MSSDAQYNQPQIYPARLLVMQQVPCPNCQQNVQGFSGCEVEGDRKSVGGSRGAAGKLAPEQLINRTTWTLYPCSCKVDQFWASSFAEEMTRREKGGAPLPVHGLHQSEREARQKAIESKLVVLYRKRDAAKAAGAISRIKALERDIVLEIQNLCILIPGAHNTLPSLNLHDEVTRWARENNLRVPPGNNQALESDAAASITVRDIHLLLAVDPDYRHIPAGMIASEAKAIYDQLAAYVVDGTPMHRKSITVIAKLIPNADMFLTAAHAVDAIDDPNPLVSFTDDMAKRPTRKLTRLKRRDPCEDPDIGDEE